MTTLVPLKIGMIGHYADVHAFAAENYAITMRVDFMQKAIVMEQAGHPVTMVDALAAAAWITDTLFTIKDACILK